MVSSPRHVSPAKAPKPYPYAPVDVESPLISPLSSTDSVSGKMVDEVAKTYTSVKECEDAALSEIAAGNQISFTRILLQSPSPYSFTLGVLSAAKLNWCDALKSFLSALQNSCPRDPKVDISNEHPMFTAYIRKYSGCGFSSNLSSKTSLEELALMKAAIDGFAQAVQILVEFIDPNFGDMFAEPFLRYVYKNQDEASRRSCLQAILPKLEPSNAVLAIVGENGDLPTLMYLVDKMSGAENPFCATAAGAAIEHGHDEVAKWMIRQPGLIPWKRYTGVIVSSATKAQNLDMLNFLSRHVPELSPRNLPPNVTAALWAFLKDIDQDLYRKLAPKYPDGLVLYSR